MSLYITTKEINPLKEKIIHFANEWINKEKTPIPQTVLIENLEAQGENKYTVTNALIVLIRKGYLSRVRIYGEGSKNFYRVLRTG